MIKNKTSWYLALERGIAIFFLLQLDTETVAIEIFVKAQDTARLMAFYKWPKVMLEEDFGFGVTYTLIGGDHKTKRTAGVIEETQTEIYLPSEKTPGIRLWVPEVCTGHW